MLGENSDEAGSEDPVGSAEPVAHCPPPRWATGLRRVLYPDVTIDEFEGETPSGS